MGLPASLLAVLVSRQPAGLVAYLGAARALRIREVACCHVHGAQAGGSLTWVSALRPLAVSLGQELIAVPTARTVRYFSSWGM